MANTHNTLQMSLLNTLTLQINNTAFNTAFYEDINLIENINHYISWNHDSKNVMYNIILLTLSCFTWSYFMTFITMITVNKIKMTNDLLINVISLFSGYFGIVLFGYYNITYPTIAFVMGTLVFLNLQMVFSNKFDMIEYAVINSMLTTIVNTACFLLLLYQPPANFVINLNIIFDEPIVKIIE
jgi:hypothetical protein